MRAVIVREFGRPADQKIEEIADPVPGVDEVLIDIEAVAANYVDLLVIAGKYQFLPTRPFSPGKLPAGTVRVMGSGVRTLKTGDRVLTLLESGGYAEKAVVRESACFLLPKKMSFVEAASTALAFDTAWFALRERARLAKGETTLVLGASGAVGLAAIQLAKAMGARVIAGLSSLAKEPMVRQAGADDVIDLSRENIREAMREQVWALTNKRGVDVVIDPLGDRFFEASLRSLAWCGRLVVIGFAAGEIPTVKANYLLVKNIEVSGLQVSDYRKRRPELMKECMADIFALYESGAIKAPPAITRPLNQFAEALCTVSERSAGARVILCPTIGSS
jgi:NADPH2:quinone reductase